MVVQDVYWAKEGRTSVDVAVAAIAAGDLAIARIPLWSAADKAVDGLALLLRRGPPG